MPGLPCLRLGILFTLALAFASGLCAQNLLLAQYKGKFYPVRDAGGSRPYVDVDGKRVVADGNRFALHKVEEYLPVFIAVRHIEARTTALQFAGSGSSINNQFEFRAEFSSRYRLEHVFLVLELTFEDGSKNLFLHEIGRMAPNEIKPLDLAVPTGYPLGAGHYRLHLFVGGQEVLHSQQSFAEREGALDRMVARRNAGRIDANPELLVGTPPEYPRKLAKTKTKGHVVLRVRILPTGAVTDPTVLSASDPAFGEAALEVIREWRFLPRTKGGQPVAARVDIPLDFTPGTDGS